MKRSKYLVFVVLSCSLFIAWYGRNVELVTPSNATSTHSIIKLEPAGSIWDSMNQEFELDHKPQSTQVKAAIRDLLSEPGKFRNVLEAAGPYIYYIYEQTKLRGLPAEIALIPVIESEFNPNDQSSKRGARGLWQLMSGTAHDLGIKGKSGYDGRRDVVDSTNAALAYFKDLGKMFDGNWYLAIAAYDCGQGSIKSAVRRSGSHNFWNLHLPKETKNYVPKLLAVAEIINNPEKYGVTLPPISNEPYFTQLKVKKPVNLTKIAKNTGTNIETLHSLNPAKGANHILVPVKKAPVIKAQLGTTVINT